MNKATTNILVKYFLSPLILLVLLWLIYLQITHNSSITSQWLSIKYYLLHSNPWILMIAILLSPVNWLTEAIKWKLLVSKIESFPLHRSFASVLTGWAVAIISPGKIGDFAGRILYIQNKNKLRAILASIVNSFAQLLVTFIVGCIGLTYLYLHFSGSWQLSLLIVAISISILLALGYFNIDKIAKAAEGKVWLRKIILSVRVLKRFDKKVLVKVLGWATIRFLVYNIQFVLFLHILGASVNWWSFLMLSVSMFWLITVIPSFFVADLGVRAFVANLIFINTGILENNLIVISASYAIWLLNWALTAIIGSLLILSIKWFR